ncbi:hypothetical protein [Aquamicrobium ahrensii]|uniref:Uncharacterized protein n=1 Tax=Aquamicrobium ahrensii TaxID=469551 RepID=A0ABV2KS56_9HYPH
MSLASAQKERRELLGNFDFASFGNAAAIRVRDVSPIDKEGCAACNRQVAWQAGYFEDKSVTQRIIVNSTGMVTNEIPFLSWVCHRLRWPGRRRTNAGGSATCCCGYLSSWGA